MREVDVSHSSMQNTDHQVWKKLWNIKKYSKTHLFFMEYFTYKTTGKKMIFIKEDAMLMSSLSRNRSMSKSMRQWMCSNNNWRRRSFNKSMRQWMCSNNNWRRRSFSRRMRQWRRIWKGCSRSEGGRGRRVWWTLSHLMTTLGGPHNTSLRWRYHVHVARKAADGVVFINVKLTLICC